MSFALKCTYAALPRTERGKPMVLGGDPKGKNFLYCNGNSVFIRNIDDPSICDVYTEHSFPTTVAKYSPSGFYIASADITGKVRIWDTTQKEHILKNEFQPLGGAIKDLSWSGDSQRIVVVGDGREKFGHVFNAETGTSVGEIMGQSKSINATDFRAARPFRIATASEDNTVAFFHGPPFKFQFTITDHSRFVNALKYAPNGELFVTGGAEGAAFLYDGKTGEKKGELGHPAHKGGIYAVCFSPDSSQVLTVSGDKTAKIWDAASGQLVQEFAMGTKVEDMQVGCLWQGQHIITVSLSGCINYLDKNNPDTPLRIIKGHQKPITALAVTEDKSGIFTASFDGNICHWDVKSGTNDLMSGKGHSNQVQDMVVQGDDLVTIGLDDTILYSSVSTKQYGKGTSLPSQPRGLSVRPGGLAVVACINHVIVMRDRRPVYMHKVDYEPQCVSIHPGETEVAVGGGMDNQVHVLTLSGDTLQEKSTYTHMGALTDIKYSPDGAFLTACDTNRKVLLYQLPDYKTVVSTEWANHTARVNTVAWTPDGRHIATGALDTNLVVWSSEKKSNYFMNKGAHPMSQINRVQWLDNNTLVSVGQDSCLKQWSISYS